VISFENYSVNSVGAQIKAVDIPDEFSEKPRILILACENDAYPALDMAGMSRNEYSAFVRIIPIRCLGSVNTIWITDALNAGYDGVMLMAANPATSTSATSSRAPSWVGCACPRSMTR